MRKVIFALLLAAVSLMVLQSLMAQEGYWAQVRYDGTSDEVHNLTLGGAQSFILYRDSSKYEVSFADIDKIDFSAFSPYSLEDGTEAYAFTATVTFDDESIVGYSGYYGRNAAFSGTTAAGDWSMPLVRVTQLDFY